MIEELVVGLALVALIAGSVALVRLRVESAPVSILALTLRDGTVTDLSAWTQFFRSVHALRRPSWQAMLFGQVWVGFEFRSEGGALHARCAVPIGQRRLVQALLESAISGIEASDV